MTLRGNGRPPSGEPALATLDDIMAAVDEYGEVCGGGASADERDVDHSYGKIRRLLAAALRSPSAPPPEEPGASPTDDEVRAAVLAHWARVQEGTPKEGQPPSDLNVLGWMAVYRAVAMELRAASPTAGATDAATHRCPISEIDVIEMLMPMAERESIAVSGWVFNGATVLRAVVAWLLAKGATPTPGGPFAPAGSPTPTTDAPAQQEAT